MDPGLYSPIWTCIHERETVSFCQANAAHHAGFPGGVCEGQKRPVDVDWFGTVRGRLGWAIGNSLIYGTGGFAAGGVKATSLYTDNNTSWRPNGVDSSAIHASRQDLTLGNQYRLDSRWGH